MWISNPPPSPLSAQSPCIFRLAEPQLGENVAVIGLGLLGLLTIQLASAAGCNVLGIDLDPKRVKLASSLGLQAVPRKGAESASTAFTTNRGLTSSFAPTLRPMTQSNSQASMPVTAPRLSQLAQWAEHPRKIYYEKLLSTPVPTPSRYDANYEENSTTSHGYIRWTEATSNLSLICYPRKLKKSDFASLPIEDGVQAYEVITERRKNRFWCVIEYRKGKAKAKVVSLTSIKPSTAISSRCRTLCQRNSSSRIKEQQRF
jgi:hypothetical protein